jgi:hypothetical protein
MGLRDDLESRVDGFLKGNYATTRARVVRDPKDIPLGNNAKLLTAATLFIDVRQSSDITNTFRRQTAAKMVKSYFSGAVKITNANDGVVRSFNGDGMLAIFLGEKQCDNAVKAAMQIQAFVRKVLRPKSSAISPGTKGRSVRHSTSRSAAASTRGISSPYAWEFREPTTSRGSVAAPTRRRSWQTPRRQARRQSRGSPTRS